MAVVRDAFTTAPRDGGSDLTFSHTIAAGSDLALIALISVDGATNQSPVTATWNGVSMALVGEVVGSATSQHTAAFVLEDPDTGTHNVVFEWLTDPVAGAVAISYFGVDQATPTDGFQSGSGSVTSLSETVASASGDMVVDAAGVNGNPTVTLGNDGSQVANFNCPGGGVPSSGTMFVCGEAAGAASVIRSWSWSGAQRSAQVAFNINSAAGAPAGDPILLRRPGRGAGW